MIHILNRFDEIIGFLSNENPETPVYWGGKHTEKLNSAANYYEFSTVTDHEYVQELTNMNKVVARHPDGYFIPFRIHRVTQRNKDGIREKFVEVEGEHMRLRTAKVLSPITLTSATLKTAARFILSGTGWQVGLIEFAGAKTIEFKDFTNALKALHQINELFGMEIRFRIVIQRNRVIGRYVDFLERVGEDNGKEIVLGKDLISVERMEDSNEVYTALIGIGKANEEGKFITFEGINGGKNYVEDQEAFQRWGDENGHHIGVYYVEPKEGEELTPEIVRGRTKEALKRHIESVVQYKVTGASLEKVFGLDHEKVRKGDTVRIKDTGFTPPLYLEARVLETFRYDDPGKEDEFLLGNYQELKIKPNQILLDLQKQLFRNERKWSSAVRKVRSTLPPEDRTVIWIDTTEVPNIVKTYNESDDTWEKASPTVAAEVGAETPEGAEAKANTAKSEAIAYMNTQLTNYVNATLYSDDISELQAQIDNQIQSHFKPYEPSLSNEPASDWRTDEEKRHHVGDLFYNTETGHSYRFALDRTTFKWLMVRDEGIAKALADAAQAQDTADSKRRTFVSQPNTPYDEGDLWDKDGAVFRSTMTKTKSASFSLSDWVKIGDVTSENKAKDTDSVGGVPAEDIETKDGASGKANQAKADAQTFTETYANKKVTQSTSPPETPSYDDLWIDISVNPYVWKRWGGETWKKATPTSAAEVGAETPNGAQYKANQAKEDAVSIAQQDAAKKAASAVSESRTFTEEFANKKISQGTSAPSAASADDLWIDTSQTPYVWKRYTGSSWVKATPTTASEVGAETPAGAQAKANAARDDAISIAASDAESKAAAAESAAKTYAEAQANAAKTAAQTHADGKVTAEEEARIQQAQANLANAKKHADDAAEAAKSAAKNYADIVAESAGASSKAFTQDYAQKQVTQQSAAPSNPETNDLWIDTTKNPHIWKKWNGSYWIKLTPTTAAEVGAETPAGAQAKANVAEADAVSAAKADATAKANQAKIDAESAANSYTQGYAEKKITRSTTAPSSPGTGDMWIDNSENVWKRWNGSSWVKLTRTALPELTGKVSAGQVSANIISSDHIATAGLDAGVIKTGVLDAGRVRIGSGSVFENGFDPSTKETPSGAQSKANAAKSSAISTASSDATSKANAAESSAKTYANNRFDGTKNLVSGWKYGSTTYIDGGNIYANSLTANAIASKTITGNEIATATITAQQMVISDYTNLASGSDFEDEGQIPWDGLGSNFIVDSTVAHTGLKSLKIPAASGGQRSITLQGVNKVSQGEKLYVEFWTKTTTDWNGTSGQSKLRFGRSDGSFLNSFAVPSGTDESWKKVSAIFTATASELLRIQLWMDHSEGTAWIDDIVIRRMNGGELIVDGTLTANKFASKTITANELKSGIIDSDLIVTSGLDAGVIKFGTMSGSRIQVGTLDADRIGAGVIDARRIAIGSGTSFDSGFDPSTKETPGGAQAKANAAETSAISSAASDATSKANAAKSSAISSAASDATSKANAAESAAKKHADDTYSGTKSLVDGWKYGSTTYINGGDIYTNTITANQIASKTITANQLKAGIIDSDLIVSAGLDAGVIKFGTMDGNRIATKSLTSDKIASVSPNLMPSGWDQIDQLTSLQATSGQLSTFAVTSDYSFVGEKSIITVNSAANSYFYPISSSGMRDAIPGQRWIFSAYAMRPYGSVANVLIVMVFRDENGNSLGSATSSSVDVDDTVWWKRLSCAKTAPSGTVKVSGYARTTSSDARTVFWDAFQLEIVDDASQSDPSDWKPSGATVINGGNIIANTITTSQITTVGLDAGVIKFGSMDGDRIATNSLHANRLQSKTIDSDLIVTAGLDAGVIKFGTMHGNRIISNSLHGDKITAGTLNADRLEANSIIADDIKFTGKLDGATGNFAGELTAYSLKVDTQMGGEILIGTGSYGSGGAVWNDGGDVRIGNDSLNGTGRAINIESSSGDVEVDVRGTLHAKEINFVESISADEVYGTEVHGTNIYSTTYRGNNVISDKVTTSVVELASGDANIVLSDDNPNFRGYSMGAVIQFNGDGRADGALIKAAGIHATSVLDLGTGRMYGDNGTLFRFGDDGSSYQHHTLKFGNAMFKSLNSSMSSIQARNLTDSDYIQLAASDFRVGSLRAYKKNIEPYTGEALQKVLSTQVYHYHLNSDDDRELKRVGLIYEESDADVVDPSGDGMSSYSMTAVLWKALQDLNNKVVDLENKIA